MIRIPDAFINCHRSTASSGCRYPTPPAGSAACDPVVAPRTNEAARMAALPTGRGSAAVSSARQWGGDGTVPGSRASCGSADDEAEVAGALGGAQPADRPWWLQRGHDGDHAGLGLV